MNILGKRYFFFAFSLVIIIPGLVILIWQIINNQVPLSIDFTGGNLLEVRFEAAQPAPADIIAVYEDLKIRDVQVQTTEKGTYVIRSAYLDNETRSLVLQTLEAMFNSNVELLQAESVGPAIGKEVTARATIAVAVAALAVVFYITTAFRGMDHALRYGICAIIAMLHDVVVVFSVTAIGSV
ncbi:MAG: hypothetical protein NZL98_11150, partial [Anaerolineales bacterium]|nr:hypothetical protein [Anaerolineales bacterium]